MKDTKAKTQLTSLMSDEALTALIRKGEVKDKKEYDKMAQAFVDNLNRNVASEK